MDVEKRRAHLKRIAKLAGRKPGQTTSNVLERDLNLNKLRQHVYDNTDKLVATQMAIAHGTNYIVKSYISGGKLQVDTVTDKKELVEALKCILDPKLEGKSKDKTYYQIRTDKPDARAIENLLDRAYGKPNQTIEGNITHMVGIVGIIQQLEDEDKIIEMHE